MKVAVTWEMFGYIDIEANNMEEAMRKFYSESDHIVSMSMAAFS